MFELAVLKYGTSIYFTWLIFLALMNFGMCIYACGWYDTDQNTLWISEMGYTSFLVYAFTIIIIWISLKFEDPAMNLVYIWGLSAIINRLTNEKGFLIFGFTLIIINIGILVFILTQSFIKGL